MISGLEHNTVNTIFVQFKDSCCPPNAVAFGNCQNNAFDGFPAIIGVYKNCVTILRKPLITILTTQQMGFILAIARTGCNVAVPPDSMVFTLWIRAEVIRKIHHGLLSYIMFSDCTFKRRG